MENFLFSTFYWVDYKIIDKLIKKYCKVDYNSVADNEWCNNSSYTILGISDNFEKEEEKLAFLNWVEGKRNNSILGDPGIKEYLDYLCLKKIIPSGNYLIEVCW